MFAANGEILNDVAGNSTMLHSQRHVEIIDGFTTPLGVITKFTIYREQHKFV